MNKEQAFQIIEQALNISAQKGVFGLQDSATILKALNILKQEIGPQPELPKPGKMVGSIKEDKTKQD